MLLKRTSLNSLTVCWFTISRIHNLNCGGLGELQQSHHRVRQLNLKALQILKLLVGEDLHLPGGRGLPWVELDLLLGFATEIFVLLCSSIYGRNT